MIMIDERLMSDLQDELHEFVILLHHKHRKEKDPFISELIRQRMHKADRVFQEMMGDDELSLIPTYDEKLGRWV